MSTLIPGDVETNGLKIHYYRTADEAGARPTLVKPNLQEFNELLGEELSGMDAIAAAARHMAGQIGSQVVVTLGERGMVAADGDRLFTAQAPRVPALSAIGSGDAFLAGMAAVLLEGGSFVEMLRMGLAASAASPSETRTRRQSPARRAVCSRPDSRQ
mgnify:CR=1 FL=1